MAEKPFDSKRKLMSTQNKYQDSFLVHTKGAVDQLLEICSHILVNEKVVKLSNEMKKRNNRRNN